MELSDCPIDEPTKPAMILAIIPMEPPFLVIPPAIKPIKPPTIIDQSIIGLPSISKKSYSISKYYEEYNILIVLFF